MRWQKKGDCSFQSKWYYFQNEKIAIFINVCVYVYMCICRYFIIFKQNSVCSLGDYSGFSTAHWTKIHWSNGRLNGPYILVISPPSSLSYCTLISLGAQTIVLFVFVFKNVHHNAQNAQVTMKITDIYLLFDQQVSGEKKNWGCLKQQWTATFGDGCSTGLLKLLLWSFSFWIPNIRSNELTQSHTFITQDTGRKTSAWFCYFGNDALTFKLASIDFFGKDQTCSYGAGLTETPVEWKH